MERSDKSPHTKPTTDKITNTSHNKKASTNSEGFSVCHIVPDYRTFIEDYLKIVEFIEWLKENYPEKATFLTKKS